MHARLFASLATASCVDAAQPFSQHAWRMQHYPHGPSTLCTALTTFWLASIMSTASNSSNTQASPPLAQLGAPGAALCQRLATLQALGYYPAFPPGYQPGADDLRLLQQKYGTRDWHALRQAVADLHQGDFILHDLARQFDWEAATITRFDAMTKALPALPAGAAGVGVLRYVRRGQPGGHRFACYTSHDGRCHFFDPNAGAVTARNAAVFAQWSTAFLRHAPYRALAPAPGEALLTIYTLSHAAPRRHPDAPFPGDFQHERAYPACAPA